MHMPPQWSCKTSHLCAKKWDNRWEPDRNQGNMFRKLCLFHFSAQQQPFIDRAVMTTVMVMMWKKRKQDSSEVVSILLSASCRVGPPCKQTSRKCQKLQILRKLFSSLFCSAFIDRPSITTSVLQWELWWWWCETIRASPTIVSDLLKARLLTQLLSATWKPD